MQVKDILGTLSVLINLGYLQNRVQAFAVFLSFKSDIID